jgi:hypothetical protein
MDRGINLASLVVSIRYGGESEKHGGWSREGGVKERDATIPYNTSGLDNISLHIVKSANSDGSLQDPTRGKAGAQVRGVQSCHSRVDNSFKIWEIRTRFGVRPKRAETFSPIFLHSRRLTLPPTFKSALGQLHRKSRNGFAIALVVVCFVAAVGTAAADAVKT